MAGTIDRKTSVSLSIPASMIELIDKKRGKVSRSSYVLEILENNMPGYKLTMKDIKAEKEAARKLVKEYDETKKKEAHLR